MNLAAENQDTPLGNSLITFSVMTPFVMDYLEKRGTLCRYPWMTLPATLGILGLCLTFATPLACAFFKQRASIPYNHLEPELRVRMKQLKTIFH